eukprot:GHUV01030697.1.p2 GENE.GHUV01030697.1~~GHUV01030697.1.p2  ORF type:complete len:108 (-),score=26.37 GHUV01030697.1:846-1169(-)
MLVRWSATSVCCCIIQPCSGTITVDEMREGLMAKGGLIPESELQRIMENADVNGDGKVDYEEFLAATMHLGKLEREENLYKAFQVGGKVHFVRCDLNPDMAGGMHCR